MNLTIYDYPLPKEEINQEAEMLTMIPYRIYKPLCIHDNYISFLIDIDAAVNRGEEPDQLIHIVRARSTYDLSNFCSEPQKVAALYTYLGFHDNAHYFVNIE